MYQKYMKQLLAVPLKGDETEIFASGRADVKWRKSHCYQRSLEVINPTLVRLEICGRKYHQVKECFGKCWK